MSCKKNAVIEFWLEYAPKGEDSMSRSFVAQTNDFKAYIELAKVLEMSLLVERLKPTDIECNKFSLEASDSRIAKVFSILKSVGLTPVYQRGVRIEETHRLIPVHRSSPTNSQRIDASEYLRLAFSEARVGYHYTTNGDTIVAMAEKAEFKKTTDIGDLAPSRRLAISAKFMESFQAAGLKGAAFMPLEWRSYPGRSDVPDIPLRTHWLSAEKELPRCLTPRIGLSGGLTGIHFWDNEELIRHAVPYMECGFDDEGITDCTLRFRRKEVERLGEFDIAHTYEWIHLVGEVNPRWFPLLIVSQRFRQWAKKQKYKLHYGLCELVD